MADDPSDTSSEYSSEDDDAKLLTDHVQEKLLTTIARIRAKDPSLYELKTQIFKDNDFDGATSNSKHNKDKRLSYRQLTAQVKQDSSSEESMAPAAQQEQAKQRFKQALKKVTPQPDEGFLKKVEKKPTKKQPQTEQEKLAKLTANFSPQSAQLLKTFWTDDDKLDQTDLFLRNYILDKKWISRKKPKVTEDQQLIDDEDEDRSLEMDCYEAQYNFRFEEEGGTKIQLFPRHITDSVRVKPETRKEKRKKVIENKRKEEQRLHQEADTKKAVIKSQILAKAEQKENQNEDNEDDLGFDHDWFFCDDCKKPFNEYQVVFRCQSCEDYMLCSECQEQIIHPHNLIRDKIQKGFGAPAEEACEKQLQKLIACKKCRRHITPSMKHYSYTDKGLFTSALCAKCYDQSDLSTKRNYKLIEPSRPDIETMLDQEPEKVKDAIGGQDIDELVDQYLKQDFEGVLAGGERSKFRYIKVKPESFGLSDEQILMSSDKELNKYVSVRRLAPYADRDLKVRNSVYRQKVGNIDRSVRYNRRTLRLGMRQIHKMKTAERIQDRLAAKIKRKSKKLRIVNLSSEAKERSHFVSASRLQSYGLTTGSMETEN